MNRSPFAMNEPRDWIRAGAVAFAAHAGAAALVFAWAPAVRQSRPEPAMVVELPGPQAPSGEARMPPAPAALAQAPLQPMAPPPRPQMPRLPVSLPAGDVPVPTSAESLAPPAVSPAAPAPLEAAAPAAGQAASAGDDGRPAAAAGSDPRARQREADYFALVSQHLNRRKVYPPEARRARIQGVVTVRFTVDRNGAVSGLSIRRSSGHELLDRATLELVQRVAPLPSMPASMQRDSITLSLPIDYSLRTS